MWHLYTMTLNSILNYEIFQLGDFKLLLGNLLVGLIIAAGAILLLFILKKIILKPRFFINKIDEKRRIAAYSIIKYFIWIISVFIILKAAGVEIGPLLLGSSVLLIGLGFGLQNIFKDFVSGLFLLFEGTIKIGDVIEVDNIIGKVTEINLRSSEIFTRDDMTIIVPNSKFIVEQVVNWSHNEQKARFAVKVNVAYGSDTELVFKCLEETMSENRAVSKKPIPFVRFTDFGESSLNFEMLFYSKNIFRIENVKSDLRRSVYLKLKKNGLAIPFPQRDVHIKGIEKMLRIQE